MDKETHSEITCGIAAMRNLAARTNEFDPLYPATEPFDAQEIDVQGGHRIYFEQCGSAKGVPVVVLHGGPGGGCSPAMRRYFDPATYRVVLLDQRGCGRSAPRGSVDNNTTWDLVSDIERIRELLGIERWIVFGGSWGAALALIYAEKHPDRIAHLVLRGVFLMTSAELAWFYGGGVAKFWPDRWAEFIDPIPTSERSDLVAAYHKRLFSGDTVEEMRFAKCWFDWENRLSTLNPRSGGGGSSLYAHAFSRLECHYFVNNGFLESDGQILDRIGLIDGIPGDIVQGRYDMVCPPATAFALAERWPKSKLRMVDDAGHASSEPSIARALKRSMDELRGNFHAIGF